jgi:hypothetical protein
MGSIDHQGWRYETVIERLVHTFQQGDCSEEKEKAASA